MVKCVVQGCPNRSDNNKGAFPNRPSKRFFNFPNDQARVKVWLAALRETEKEDSTEEHRICEDHFLTDHITPRGISEDAIPIMPPYLDGPLSLISPWGEDSSDEEEFVDDDDASAMHNDDVEEEYDESQAETEPSASRFRELVEGTKTKTRQGIVGASTEPKPVLPYTSKGFVRQDLSLALLTKKFLRLMSGAPHGIMDLNLAAQNLHTRKRRVYDITNCLEGIKLIQKQSANKIKWIGLCPVTSFVGPKQRLQRELQNLKTVEESLDALIKTCAQQLFDMTDSLDNIELAYVTHSDISAIKVFQEQTVVAIKAPEETKLEVPTPKEDGIQIHLKGGRGPIKVLTCEMDGPQRATQGSGKTTGFLSLEESRIKTMLLHTGASASQNAVQSG
ncbi:transcription factor E2F6 isoform X1 [Oncorhynchus mykiss]|uniref:E2F transcription factor 6 n=1 Tax=Oncorhynchus mykiss TaxID=8022 RepID=A0A8C7UZN3_ONCMY|nr:transcription factor E2F6 isoform X1 [Oncorhynchus mykiss]